MDGQLWGVIDIWWQTETKNCTAQEAKVARALKFPGTYNAPTFETTASLLRAVLTASSNNSAAVLQSTQSHVSPIADYQPTLTDNFVFGFKSRKLQLVPQSPIPHMVYQLRVAAALPVASCD